MQEFKPNSVENEVFEPGVREENPYYLGHDVIPANTHKPKPLTEGLAQSIKDVDTMTPKYDKGDWI